MHIRLGAHLKARLYREIIHNLSKRNECRRNGNGLIGGRFFENQRHDDKSCAGGAVALPGLEVEINRIRPGKKCIVIIRNASVSHLTKLPVEILSQSLPI